eukprot:scaffold95836_cov78-Phaeocystis_antarctica.AAC.1
MLARGDGDDYPQHGDGETRSVKPLKPALKALLVRNACNKPPMASSQTTEGGKSFMFRPMPRI